MSGIGEFWIWGVGLVGFLALWPLSLWRRDSSVVDFWWGPGFGAIALAAWIELGQPTGGSVLFLLVPLWIWSARLGLHLGLRRLRDGTEDPRYTELRNRYGPGWWWKSLFIVFILQGVLQALVASGVVVAITPAVEAPAGLLVWALTLTAVLAVVVQSVSDYQLDAHKSRADEHSLLTTGLRGIVRYPSYAAEIVFWLSMNLLAIYFGVWWAVAPAALIVLLLRYVSGVVVLEDRLARTRPQFEAYRQTVPLLVPQLRSLGQTPHRQNPAE